MNDYNDYSFYYNEDYSDSAESSAFQPPVSPPPQPPKKKRRAGKALALCLAGCGVFR